MGRNWTRYRLDVASCASVYIRQIIRSALSPQIDLRERVGWLHTRHDFIRQRGTDAAGPSIGRKDNLLSLQGASGCSYQRIPSVISIDAGHRRVGLQVHSIPLHELGGQLRHKFVWPERACGNIGCSSGAFDGGDLAILALSRLMDIY